MRWTNRWSLTAFKGRGIRLPARQDWGRGGSNGDLLGSVHLTLKFELQPKANTVNVSHKKGTGRLAPGGCHLGPVQEWHQTGWAVPTRPISAGSQPCICANPQVLCFSLHQKIESFYFRKLIKRHIWNRMMRPAWGNQLQQWLLITGFTGARSWV